MGTPNHIYTWYGMVWYSNTKSSFFFFYIISVYTVCHVDHYVQVH